MRTPLESRSPRRRFRRAPDEKRARIISVARTCFSEHRYGEVTTAEIAKRAQVSEGTIFHHFGTKLELLRQVADQYAGELGKAMFLGASDEFLRIEEIMRRASAFVRKEGSLGLSLGTRGDPKPAIVIHEALRCGLVSQGTEILHAWQKTQVTRPMNARLVAEILFPILNTMLVRILMQGDEIPEDYLREASLCMEGAIAFISAQD